MLRMDHQMVQTQRQQLVLTQKMQQGLHMLQLSTLELDQYLQQQLESNPFLEMEALEVAPDALEVAPPKDDNESFDESFDLDRYADKLDAKYREGRDLSYNPDLEAKRRYYEDSITQAESLSAHLLNQLHINFDDDTRLAIGERIIIGDIDARGYFTSTASEIAQEMEVPIDLVQEVLDKIKSFEPTGVGASDIIECLLLQVDAEYPKNTLLRSLITDHFDELAQRQVPRIAKAMKISNDDVENLLKLVATLNPWPGHEYSTDPPQYIAPDVVVEEIDGEYIVRAVDERLPVVKINDSYSKDMKSQAQCKEDKTYIRQQMDAAKWLKRNLSQRKQTICRVSQAIVDVQTEFMRNGVEHIKPLVLQDIAQELGVHETTVSRATRGKYIQTPQGIFELKYFFSPGLRRDSGEDQSSKSVQEKIKQTIENENKKKPLSDQKIADMLQKEGLDIARRTVTKYRKLLNIPSTTMRREYSK